MFDLKGRNYIVTGGGRGIGYAVTRTIAEMGGNVAVLDVLESPVKDFETLQGDFGVKTRYIHTDVTKEESLTKGFEQSIHEFGTLDGWWERLDQFSSTLTYDSVTAAGIALDKPFVEQGWEEVSRVLDVNVSGPASYSGYTMFILYRSWVHSSRLNWPRNKWKSNALEAVLSSLLLCAHTAPSQGTDCPHTMLRKRQ